MKRITRTSLNAGITVLVMLLHTPHATAGQLAKPAIILYAPYYVQNFLFFSFVLSNLNATYSLGSVYWTARILKNNTEVFSVSGETEVAQSQSVTVTPSQEYMPTETGQYQIEVKANSAANISGEQTEVVTVEVMTSPECTTPVIRMPSSNLVIVAESNTITYTAPPGCCYRITPFINTGVWYSMNPNTTQTISDGQTVTFTLTPKDPSPAASVVAFHWVECSKGTPNGKDYIVVSPIRINMNDTSSTLPYGPGMYLSVFGDPVATSTGQFVLNNRSDLQFSVTPLLEFSHTYNGGNMDAGFIPGLGLNWQHSYSSHIVAGGDRCYVQMADGRRFPFEKVAGTWQFRGKSIAIHLQESAIKWIVTDVTNKIQYTFDKQGKLAIVDDGNWPIYLTWTDEGLVSATDSMSHTLTFTNDSLGRITEVSNGYQNITFSYNARGELSSFTSATGVVTQYSYNPDVPGRMQQIGIQGSMNPQLTLEYDSRGKVVRQYNSDGAVWAYSYTVMKATLTDPDGYVEVHDLTASGKVTALGPVDEQVVLKYDANGFPTEVVNAGGTVTRTTWHQSGLPASRETADGITQYTYTVRSWNGAMVYDLTEVLHPDGSTTKYEYDGRGRTKRIEDRMLREWLFTTDGKTGQRTQQTDPMGRMTTSVFDAMGHLQSVTLATGASTTFATNATGSVTKVTNSDLTSRSFQYDTYGRLTKTTNELGLSTNIAYNQYNQQTGILLPSGAQYTFAYGSEGRLASSKMPTGGLFTFDYTPGGRLSSIHDPMNMAITIEYDESGNVQSEINRDGDAVTYTYDVDGNLASARLPEGGLTQYRYDGRGRIIEVSSPLGLRSANTYDANGRLASYTEFSGRNHTFAYDASGLLVSNSVADQITAQFEYNAVGSLTKITDAEGMSWLYAYDNGGRLASIADPTGRTLLYAYDNRDRAEGITFPGQSGNVAITYDATGNLLRMLYNDGTDITLNYDGDGRVVSTNADECSYDADGKVISSNGIAMLHNENGWITKLTFDAGKELNYQYDAAGRVTGISDWLSGSMRFSHDKDGNLTQIERQNGINTSFIRNADGRITRITEAGIATTDINYGNTSRIQSVVRTGYLNPNPVMGEWAATYDAGNVRTDTDFDEMGRTIVAGGDTLEWDAASRLKRINRETDGSIETDGFGRVIANNAVEPTWRITWNDAFGEGLPGLVKYVDETWYVVPTPGGSVAYLINKNSGARLFPHYTESGNTAFITDDNGSVVLSIAYEPYGKVLDAQGNTKFPFLFGGAAGVLRISNTLYAMPGRIYNAAAGRFLTPDPVRSRHPMQINPFQYSQCDPINWNDWTGRTPQQNPNNIDEIVDASNRRLEEAMRKTQERYEESMRKLEEEAAQRRARREAEETAAREARERLEEQRRREDEELKKDRLAFDRAQAKAAALNEVFTPMPANPCRPDPAPGTGLQSSTPGEQGATTNPGSNGQPPSPGGTRTRPPKPKTTPAAPNNGNSGGSNGGTPQPAPGGRGNQGGLGPQGNPYGTFFPPTVYVIGAGISGFFEGLFNPWDSYWKDVFN